MLTRKLHRMAVVFLCLLESAPGGDFVYKDFGGGRDVSPGEDLYFSVQEGPGLWYLDWPSLAPHQLAFFETQTDFWWVGAPKNPSPAVNARAVMFRRKAVLRAKADGFTGEGDLYLTVRFKDQCRPGDFPGVPVFSRVQGQTALLGTLGGKNDGRWKTETLVVPPDKRRKERGEYVFVFGEDYRDQILGDFPLDKIKLSRNRDRKEFEPDAPGLWPSVKPDNLRFGRIGQTNEYIPGQGPFFPFGFYSGDPVTHGGSASSEGRGDRDSWEIMESARVNTYVLHGWDQNWDSQWKLFPSEAPWAAPGTWVEAGFKEILIQAGAHGIRVIPNPLTDTRAFWILREGGSPAALRRMTRLAGAYKNHPAILAYNPVDEWDHGDPGHAKPQLFVRQLFQAFKQADPTRPVFMTLMGYMGPQSWRVAAESADILATDTYVDDYAGEGGLEKGARLAAERLDAIRALGNSKAVLYVGHFGEGPKDIRFINGEQRLPNASEMLFQGYLGIVHGAQGLLFFRFIHPSNPRYPNLEETWRGFRQMGGELFGKEGLASVLIAPSITEDIMGERGKLACDNPAIHYILKRTAEGALVLIAVNVRETDQRAGFTFRSPRVSRVRVRFENRVLPVSGSSFSDQFGRFARRVYDLETR